jgi:hypothetical protein
MARRSEHDDGSGRRDDWAKSVPDGLERELSLIDIVWWQIRDLIHHGAEMAYLRDLYAALVAPSN